MTRNLTLSKEKVRKKLLSDRSRLTNFDVLGKSDAIYKRLVNLGEIKSSKRILVYLPINSEVDTEKTIRFLIKNKKELFVTVFKNGDWLISKFNGFDNLEKGRFGILQPSRISKVDAKDLDTAILPGVAFDKRGVRLGYGRGVYDKLLSDFSGLKIGLAYDFQVVEKLPQEKHDLEMDLVVTDTVILRTS